MGRRIVFDAPRTTGLPFRGSMAFGQVDHDTSYLSAVDGLVPHPPARCERKCRIFIARDPIQEKKSARSSRLHGSHPETRARSCRSYRSYRSHISYRPYRNISTLSNPDHASGGNVLSDLSDLSEVCSIQNQRGGGRLFFGFRLL